MKHNIENENEEQNREAKAEAEEDNNETSTREVKTEDEEDKNETSAPLDSSSTTTTTTALVCKDVKSTAVVKYAAVRAPAHFLELTRDTDLKLPPDNWLRQTDQWQVLKGCWASTSSSSTMFKSLLMANDFPDCVGEVDVVSDAENIKKLLKMPYSKSHVSMMVHCVGKTLLLDDFDVHKHLLRMAKNEWAWLRKFFLEDVVQSLHKNASSVLGKNRSRGHLQHKNMLSKFLYYSISNVCDRMESLDECQTSPTRRKGQRADGGGHDGGTRVRHSSSPSSKSAETASTSSSTAFEQKWEDQLEDEEFFRQRHNCQRNVLWTFEDIRMLIGTDMPIFGGGVHPCVSLRLRDITKPINVLTGLDYWLDNLMCNVPEVMMCYHLNGIVQKYELIQTEDIPKLDNSKFSPIVIKDIAQNILSFLKSNATKAGHTYWLFKAKEGDVVKLYDLTSLCDNMREGTEQNPYSTPVAMLLYRVARNMRTSLGQDKKRMRTMCTLLENCLNLLDQSRHPQVVTSARYLLSDIYVPSTTDLSSPSTPLESEDEDDDHEEREGAESPPTTDPPSPPSPPSASQPQRSSSMDVKALCLPENNRSRNFEPPSAASVASTTPPSPASLVERCRAALRHIEEAVNCLASSESQVQTDEDGSESQATSSPRRASPPREEVQKQAKSFQAIPLHYEPLSSANGGGTDGSDDKADSELKCSLHHGGGRGESWQSFYRGLIVQKTALVAYVMAHCSYTARRYGEVLRYLEMAFCSYCAHKKTETAAKRNNGDATLLSYMLSLAGDAQVMLVQHGDRLVECQEQHQRGIEYDRIHKFIKDILNEDCDFQWATELQDKMEGKLQTSIKCYQVALENIEDTEQANRLRKRYGNVKNELGVLLMNQAQALFNGQEEEYSEDQIESLWRSSFDNLQAGAKIFEDIHDQANVALLNCNLGRLMRMRAISSGGTKEFSTKERNFCEKASRYYLRALRAVTGNPDFQGIQESIMWDLSSTYFMAATLLQDYAPLSTRAQEDIEREINEVMLKALKHCDWETTSSRQPIYQYRAANIFYRLGSLHHNTYRTQGSEGRKKQQQRSLAESYLTKAANLFLHLEESLEFLKVQLERISIHELQLNNKQLAASTKMKSCNSVLELILESVPIVALLMREQDAKLSSKADETKHSANEVVDESANVTGPEGNLNDLLSLLQQRLQIVLLNAIKLTGSAKSHKKGANQEEASLANYKKMYGEALKLSTSSANATSTNFKVLHRVLLAIRTTYNNLTK